ncbi:MAG TPA: tRNA preQ1(34) S-adenosylmethionine ribosyltransferase-isomerase QueA [Oscillatoriaceae cyanobacterium]
MQLTDFHFDVPPELIAQRPAEPRDSARLMVLERATGTIRHHVFRDLPDLLAPEYVVVVNNSRVIKARLAPRRASGDVFDLFLLRALAPMRWLCLGDALAMPEPGETLTFADSAMTTELVERRDDGTVVFEFANVPDVLAEVERIGRLPLPPYITEQGHEAGYQTVYAQEPGSVAAPTAGLHFTPEVFERLAARGIGREEVTLHVGYGTFARVQHEDLTQHVMHSEAFELDHETAERLNAHKHSGRKLLAVGTTATRTIESCADDAGRLVARSGETALFIRPPYRYKAVDALLTNFHMPGFTPIMLVAAIAGYELTMRAYQEAIAQRYRFYSFGDAMLIL